MQTKFVERHIRSLSIAKTCVDLGARIRTISYITGLAHNELVRLFFVDEQSAPRGRPPDSPEWYHQANLIEKVEAAIVVAVYCRMHELGFGPADALVSGFKHYREQRVQTPRISFDRAFDLVCHTQGIWIADRPQLARATCACCKSRYLAGLGENPRHARACPFCKLITRYWCDKRVQATFPSRSLPAMKSIQFGLLSAFLSVE
jgi:flagellar transcriptional activator FlhC